jgi:hypothetical protein
MYDLSWDTYLGHQGRSEALKVKNPLTNQRVNKLVVKAKGKKSPWAILGIPIHRDQ